MQRTTLRSQRRKNIARTAGLTPDEDEQEVIDRLDVAVLDPADEMLEHIEKIKQNPLHFHEEEEAEAEAQNRRDEEEEAAALDAPAQRQRRE